MEKKKLAPIGTKNAYDDGDENFAEELSIKKIDTLS